MISNGLSHRNQHKMLGRSMSINGNFLIGIAWVNIIQQNVKHISKKASCLQQLSYRVNIIFPLEKVFSH